MDEELATKNTKKHEKGFPNIVKRDEGIASTFKHPAQWQKKSPVRLLEQG